jgi:hypothetical protein
MVCVNVLPPEPGVDIKIGHSVLHTRGRKGKIIFFLKQIILSPSRYVSPNLPRKRMIFTKLRVDFMPIE